MRAGKLDRKIIIENATEAQDSFGQAVETWATFATVWADVQPMTANERFLSGAEHSIQYYNFKIRYLSNVTEKMRINYDGAYWRIQGISEYGRKRELHIQAERVK